MSHYDGCRDDYCGCGQTLDAKGSCEMGSACPLWKQTPFRQKTDDEADFVSGAGDFTD